MSPRATPRLSRHRARGSPGARRRRSHRIGRSLLRPHRGRPGHPRAGERALAPERRSRRARNRARDPPTSEVPLLLFTYLNPVLRYGLERWRRRRSGRHRWLPAHRCFSVEEATSTWRHAAPRSTRCFSPRRPAPSASEAGGAIFHRLRLSGLADRRHRRARFAVRSSRRWSTPCAPLPICRLPSASAFAPGARRGSRSPGGCRRGGQRAGARDREAMPATRTWRRNWNCSSVSCARASERTHDAQEARAKLEKCREPSTTSTAASWPSSTSALDRGIIGRIKRQANCPSTNPGARIRSSPTSRVKPRPDPP